MRKKERFKSVLSESTEDETHLSIKFSNQNFGGILRPKSVCRTLVIGLIKSNLLAESMRK